MGTTAPPSLKKLSLALHGLEEIPGHTRDRFLDTFRWVLWGEKEKTAPQLDELHVRMSTGGHYSPRIRRMQEPCECEGILLFHVLPTRRMQTDGRCEDIESCSMGLGDFMMEVGCPEPEELSFVHHRINYSKLFVREPRVDT